MGEEKKKQLVEEAAKLINVELVCSQNSCPLRPAVYIQSKGTIGITNSAAVGEWS